MMNTVDRAPDDRLPHEHVRDFLDALRDIASGRGEQQPQRLPPAQGVVFENCTFGSGYGTATTIEIHGQPLYNRFRSIESVSVGGTVVTLRTGFKQRVADTVAGVRATARRKWKERRRNR